MAAGNKVFLTNDKGGQAVKKHYFTFHFDALSGTDTDVSSAGILSPIAGNLTDVFIFAAVTGTGGTSTTIDPVLGGTSGTSTNASFTPATADAFAGKVGSSITGFTAPVIDAANDDVAVGDKIQVDVTTAGTMNPVVSDLTVMLEFTEIQDFDPAA